MNNADRRTCQRYKFRVPIRFRGLEIHKDAEGYVGETTDISRMGFFFVTKVPLPMGVHVEFTLRVPRELSGSAQSVVQSIGNIVRSEILADGYMGYGMHIDLRHTAGAIAMEEGSRIPVEMTYREATLVRKMTAAS
jgi:hypothetical protein